jgi:hypothetical protein
MMGIIKPLVECITFVNNPPPSGVFDLAFAGLSGITAFALWKCWPRALSLVQTSLLVQLGLSSVMAVSEIVRLVAEVKKYVNSQSDVGGGQWFIGAVVWLA